MKPGQIEQVSEELAANLPVCPKCGRAPTIYKCLDGCPPRPIISIFCPCEFEYDSFKKFDWHPSLFEAVNIWSLTAKLLGSEAPQGVANMAGDGPPTFTGYPGCAVYTDLKTGIVWHWDDSAWINVSSDVPF